MNTIPAKTIVTRTKNTQWFGYEYNMNLYRGCTHGCIYCDSRCSCYRVEDFDTVAVKQDALRIVRDDLQRKARRGVIGAGAMSDPYNPYEKDLCVTRNALELINAYGFGVGIATKSTLVTRDADILQDIRAHSPVVVKITVTTCDDSLAAKIEPGAPPPSQRLDAVRALADKGICTGILMMPVLPFIEDTRENILEIVNRAQQAGARFVYPGFGVTLRDNQRDWYYRKLDGLFPGLREKYERKYGTRIHCAPGKVRALADSFADACAEKGMLYQMRDIIACYRLGYEDMQLSFR